MLSVKTWITIVVLASASTVASEDMPVDNERQCSMFKRIFTYDKHLRNSDKIIVLVVGKSKKGDDVENVAKGFRAKGMYPAVVTADELNDGLTATLTPETAVIYIMPDVDFLTANTFAARKGFLTITGLPSLVESGQASVGVELQNDRPQVLVNIPRLTTEGHELSSELLKLARVIR